MTPTSGDHRYRFGQEGPSVADRSELKRAVTRAPGRRFRISTFVLLLTTVNATAQPAPQEKRGQCPSGYASSASYCTPMAGERRPAVSKVGQCPAGWFQSGNYCKQI
jgi:hypothetical protein